MVLFLPGCVKGSREQQLVVQGDAHVAWFMEDGGDSPGGVAEEAAPAQQQHLSCGEVRRWGGGEGECSHLSSCCCFSAGCTGEPRSRI